MTLTRAAATGYGIAVLAVVLAPAVVVQSAGNRGGAGTVATTDLLLISAAAGTVGAVLAWRAVSGTRSGGRAAADRWIAALSALAVLATGATLAPTLALLLAVGIPGGAPLAPVLWGAALAIAGGTAALSGRRIHRWLGRGHEADGSHRNRRRLGSRS